MKASILPASENFAIAPGMSGCVLSTRTVALKASPKRESALVTPTTPDSEARSGPCARRAMRVWCLAVTKKATCVATSSWMDARRLTTFRRNGRRKPVCPFMAPMKGTVLGNDSITRKELSEPRTPAIARDTFSSSSTFLTARSGSPPSSIAT